MTIIEVPGRPVQSNCVAPTKRISEFVDYHIYPVVLPIVLSDTLDFLKRLKDLDHIPATFGNMI